MSYKNWKYETHLKQIFGAFTRILFNIKSIICYYFGIA